MTTEQMAHAALKRLEAWINRACAQNVRRMKESYAQNN